MKMNWSTFTAKEVTKQVNLNLNSNYSIKAIRQFYKNWYEYELKESQIKTNILTWRKSVTLGCCLL